MTKSLKVYIRDSGILHTLLGIENKNDLFGHPVFGSSWEGFALENILSAYPGHHPYFYRTPSGVEIDLILAKGTKKSLSNSSHQKAPHHQDGFTRR